MGRRREFARLLGPVLRSCARECAHLDLDRDAPPFLMLKFEGVNSQGLKHKGEKGLLTSLFVRDASDRTGERTVCPHRSVD